MKQKIGVCGVDAGLLMVGDPCYFWPNGEQPAAIESIKEWPEVCDKIKDLNESSGYQLNFKMGHAGLGVIVSTTYGDGVYPVFLETTNGKRRLIVDLD
jgi:hypothetical protein